MARNDGWVARPEDVDGQDYMGTLVLGGHGTQERAAKDEAEVTLEQMVQRGAAARRLLRALRGAR